MSNDLDDLIDAAAACLATVQKTVELRNQRAGARELVSSLHKALSDLVTALERSEMGPLSVASEPLPGSAAVVLDMTMLRPALAEARRIEMLADIAIAGWRARRQ